MVNILIGSDIVPTKCNEQLFINCNTRELLGSSLIDEINMADYFILNLEVPLTNKSNPISKCGPNLIAREECMHGLKSINSCFYTLANNHIMDQGEEGLLNTIDLLNINNIDYAGVGGNLNSMKHSFLKTIKEKRIGIYCCTESEFSIATHNSSGANPFDPLKSYAHVENLKKQCDLLIVLYHGGKEHYRYPSPNLQKIFRKFSDYGANIVIAQHTHCVGCKEDYNNSILVYGQGNFLFNYKRNEYWNNSLLLKITLDEDFSISFLPLIQTDTGVRMAKEDEKNTILSDFNNRSKQILQPGFLENEYNQLANDRITEYLVALSNNNLILRVLRKISNRVLLKIYNRNSLNRILNFIECEAHRELLIRGLKNRLRDI